MRLFADGGSADTALDSERLVGSGKHDAAADSSDDAAMWKAWLHLCAVPYSVVPGKSRFGAGIPF